MRFSERLADLEARHAAATSGPWMVRVLINPSQWEVYCLESDGARWRIAICDSLEEAELIAAMRNELSNLLAMARLAKEMREVVCGCPYCIKGKELIARYGALEGE